MPALDSNPININVRGWGQDGLRKTTKSSLRKFLPQPNGNIALCEPVRQLEPVKGDARRGKPIVLNVGARRHPLY